MRHSVDMIVIHKPLLRKSWHGRHFGKYVVIRRLTFPTGLAFPGGGIEEGEDKDMAATRELKEETGLQFMSRSKKWSWIPKIYNEPGRDPRGPATSCVAYGTVWLGTPRNEVGKTEILFLSEKEILARKKEFVFDHFQMFLDFLAL